MSDRNSAGEVAARTAPGVVLSDAELTVLNRHKVLLLDVVETITATSKELGNAHVGATVNTPGGSSWGDGQPRANDVSDPTGIAAVRKATRDDIRTIHQALLAVRDAAYHLHRTVVTSAARLEPDKAKPWQGDLELDTENMGAGECQSCERSGVRLIRSKRDRPDGTRQLVTWCNACRVEYDRAKAKNLDLDWWVWCDDRRKGVQRTDGREAS